MTVQRPRPVCSNGLSEGDTWQPRSCHCAASWEQEAGHISSGALLLLLLLVLLEEGLPVIGAAAELAQAGLLTPGGSHVSSVHVELAGHTAGAF